MSDLSPELNIAIELAHEEAVARRHGVCTLEHLLWALLHDPETAEILRQVGASVDGLKEELARYLDQMESVPEELPLQVTISEAFKRVIGRAYHHVEGSRMDAVKGFNVLIALYTEPESYAAFFLESHEVHRLDLLSYVSHGGGGGDGSDPYAEDRAAALAAGQAQESG